MQESEWSKAYPADESADHTMFSRHKLTPHAGLKNILMMVQDPAIHDIELLHFLEMWQVTYAKTMVMNAEEKESVQSSAHFLFSVTMQDNGLSGLLKTLEDQLRMMSQYASQSEANCQVYNFPEMITNMNTCNEKCIAGSAAQQARTIYATQTKQIKKAFQALE